MKTRLGAGTHRGNQKRCRDFEIDESYGRATVRTNPVAGSTVGVSRWWVVKST